MPDYNFLLGAQVPQVDPLGIAGKALTLGDLASRNQLMQLQLAKQQGMVNWFSDPNNLQSMIGGDFSSLQGNPAAPEILSQVLGIQKEQAGIGQSLSATAKNYREVRDANLKEVGNLADTVQANPTQTGVLNLQHNIGKFNLGDSYPPPPDPDAPGLAQMQWLKQVTATTAAQRAQIASEQAGAAKTQVETSLLDPKFQLELQKFAIERAKYLNGEAFQDPDSKEWFVRKPGPSGWTIDKARSMDGAPSLPAAPSPTAAPAMPTAPPATLGAAWQPGQPLPATPPNYVQRTTAEGIPYMAPPEGMPTAGGPQIPTGPTGAPQTGPPKSITELQTENAKNVATLEAGIPAAREGLNSVYRMRQGIASGQLFAGPVKGADFFKSLAGIFSQLPGAPQSLLNKVSTTQAWEAEGGELAFNMLSSLKGSVPRAQSALQMIRTIKPNTMMTPEAMIQVLNAIESRFQDQITFATDAAKAVRGGRTLSETPAPMPVGAPKVTPGPNGSWVLDLSNP